MQLSVEKIKCVFYTLEVVYVYNIVHIMYINAAYYPHVHLLYAHINAYSLQATLSHQPPWTR